MFVWPALYLCMFVLQKVCTKCGIETPGSQKRTQWLCKICSEQREVQYYNCFYFMLNDPIFSLEELVVQMLELGWRKPNNRLWNIPRHLISILITNTVSDRPPTVCPRSDHLKHISDKTGKHLWKSQSSKGFPGCTATLGSRCTGFYLSNAFYHVWWPRLRQWN